MNDSPKRAAPAPSPSAAGDGGAARGSGGAGGPGPAHGMFAATAFMVALLTGLSALGQFATNIYLPSLPDIMSQFASTEAQVQVTLSGYLVAFGLFQVLLGPVSDRVGRRPVVLGGLAVYLLGSFLCTIAGSVDTLIAGRLVQGAGAAAATVVARSVIRDVFDGAEMARVMALISVVFALVPGLVPLLGGVIQDLAGWRVTFAVTFATGLAILLLTALRLPETNLRPLPRLHPAAIAGGYRIVLGNPQFLGYALSGGFVMGGVFAFFGGSPAVYIEIFGVSATEYGFYPPSAAIGFVVGGTIVRRLAGAVPAVRICMIGLAMVMTAAVLMAALPFTPAFHKFTVAATMVLFVSGLGVYFPTAMAAALQPFPERAGTAAAALGFFQMVFAGIAAYATGRWQEISLAHSFPSVMAICAVLALAAFVLLARREPGGQD